MKELNSWKILCIKFYSSRWRKTLTDKQIDKGWENLNHSWKNVLALNCVNTSRNLISR
jgi:hypothetical protein